jgi:hypothetical protein
MTFFFFFGCKFITPAMEGEANWRGGEPAGNEGRKEERVRTIIMRATSHTSREP